MRISDWSSDVCSSDLMRREELGVEKLETANPQARDEPRHGDLRGVGLPREHALAEKGGTQRHPVKATRQLSLMPAFPRLGVSAFAPLHIGINDTFIDPEIGRKPSRERGSKDV